MIIEAKTLDEAIIQASENFGVSATKIKYELIQRPSGGFLGLFKKNAIIKVLNNKKHKQIVEKATITDDMIEEIKSGVQTLLDVNLYNIELVCVENYGEYVFIKLDGEDAASVIGKEGKRYKAFSYLLHNWISTKYNVSVRLEVSHFLEDQIAQIENYILNVVEKVKEQGKYTTKPLDGLLLKIAVERLRELIKDKYIGTKDASGEAKSIVIRDFVNKKER